MKVGLWIVPDSSVKHNLGRPPQLVERLMGRVGAKTTLHDEPIVDVEVTHIYVKIAIASPYRAVHVRVALKRRSSVHARRGTSIGVSTTELRMLAPLGRRAIRIQRAIDPFRLVVVLHIVPKRTRHQT
jgi:hypothetical protein